ncbi:MAG: glutamine-hydrolyzing carbamoyl-phosphate synthase small subunit [bacterium]|nr:glutamine-hydrolyzing carbamoyl-phosphate synthase small subunit [bacterium]
MKGHLVLEDGSVFEGESFGAAFKNEGEVVFSTGMVGYPESLTDPSYIGQILILTYPIIGNYGVPDKKYWESDKIQVSGLIVSNYIDTPSHFKSRRTLSSWLKNEKIPALEIKDTRLLTQKIRTKGTMLGRIVFEKKDIENKEFYDPNKENLVAKASTKEILVEGSGKKTVLLIDCGIKKSIKRNLIERNIRLITVPWNFDPFNSNFSQKFDAIVISSGPGNPKIAVETIKTIKKALDLKIPILGICLGNQILALAAGGDTYKLKFGHRGQNQPCILTESKRPALPRGRCFITTQNHGFAVNKIPDDFRSWFVNANDGSNEGIIHNKYPFMSVQFHPEASPGPTDTEWIFDYFLEKI